MKIPILMNGREVVRSWHTDTPVHSEVRQTGYGTELDFEVVDQLIAELTELTQTLPATTDGRREFDQRAAKLLGQRLNLPPALSAEKRFWQWFAITRAQAVVLWRWKAKARERVTESNWLGGWKDTFRRLWLRANLVRDDSSEDPFALAEQGDVDFWVGIIERDMAGCPGLVRAVVRRFFGGQETGSSQRMEHYRSTLKRLLQIRPSRVYESMSDPEIAMLVQEAVTATVPTEATAGTRKTRTATGKKKAKKTKSGK